VYCRKANYYHCNSHSAFASLCTHHHWGSKFNELSGSRDMTWKGREVSVPRLQQTWWNHIVLGCTAIQVFSFQQATFPFHIVHQLYNCVHTMHSSAVKVCIHTVSLGSLFSSRAYCRQVFIHPERMHWNWKPLRIWFQNSSLRTHIFVEYIFYHSNVVMECRRSQRLPPVGECIYRGCIMGNIILITDYAKQLCGECFFRGVSKCILSMCQGDRRNALPQ